MIKFYEPNFSLPSPVPLCCGAQFYKALVHSLCLLTHCLQKQTVTLSTSLTLLFQNQCNEYTSKCLSDSCNVNCISVCTGYQLQDLLPIPLKWLSQDSIIHKTIHYAKRKSIHNSKSNNLKSLLFRRTMGKPITWTVKGKSWKVARNNGKEEMLYSLTNYLISLPITFRLINKNNTHFTGSCKDQMSSCMKMIAQ